MFTPVPDTVFTLSGLSNMPFFQVTALEDISVMNLKTSTGSKNVLLMEKAGQM